MDKGKGGLSQCGYFADKGEGGQFFAILWVFFSSSSRFLVKEPYQ